MLELFFLGGCGLLFSTLLCWGFKFLPRERWQMMAVVPRHKHEDERWHGTNLTFYGFFIATSQLFAITLLLILFGSLEISMPGALLATGILLMVCVPASKIVAILVERKRHTFTIGGASFVGVVLAPWCIIFTSFLLTRLSGHPNMPVIPMLAAMATCYTLGEGLGRLGCISYGCCYGKPVSDCSPIMQKVFRRLNFCFTGTNKKAVYEGKLSGRELVPIQAITAIIYTTTSLISASLYLHSMFIPALLVPIMVTQGWRIISETMRADFRGFTKISAYQKMGLIAIVYMILIVLVIPTGATAVPSLKAGLAFFWHPGIILGLQTMWLFFLFFYGKSTITIAEVKYNLLEEHI